VATAIRRGKTIPFEEEAMGFKPSEKEEEYILRQEWDRRKKAEQEKQNLLDKEEKERLKKLHHMKCCKCGMEMISLDFKGITVDRCSGCEGLYLDKGELEAILKKDKSVIDRVFKAFRE
jgi:Zn-finger nucleic acid-binding protein